MKLLSVRPSTRAGKKLMATFETPEGRKRTTHFGAAGMDDYTKTRDVGQRAKYRSRHRKDLDTGDPMRAGFLSWYILWGDSASIDANVSAFKSKFNL